MFIQLNDIQATCIAQHLNAYVEQCKYGNVANFTEPCATCTLLESCDLNAYLHFKPLRQTGADITPHLDVTKEERQEHLRKLGIL